MLSANFEAINVILKKIRAFFIHTSVINAFCVVAIFFPFAGAAFAEESSFYNFDYLEKYIEKKSAMPEAEKGASDDYNIEYDNNQWNTMRRGIEKGYKPGEYIIKQKKVEDKKTADETAQTQPESALTLDLPYESGLSIKGVKTIDLKYTYKKYDKSSTDESRQNQSKEFDMQQALVVNIKGKVGRKITVNVDFDDTKELDQKRDISVVYKGDPDEVVQEAAFGDINLSLPSTEFVSYNKQVFGLKAELKYKKLRLLAIGSRTKGVTETKKFSGNTTLERKDISDSTYIRRRYYKLYLSSTHLPITRGSEKIYIDDRSATNNTPQTLELSAEAYVVGASSYTGSFDLMNPGLDYTVDYVKGIITFKKTIPENAVIAVDYKKPDGIMVSADFTPGLLKLIKDELETAGITRELKNYYSVGRNKIIRDNGYSNFIMKIIDLSRNDALVINPGGKSVPIYQNNDFTDIVMDFDSGIFYFKEEEPFPSSVYNKSPQHYYNIFVEYRYYIKTYLLRPNIVPSSERISLNAQKLQRDIDYYIDYISGFITFYNEEMLSESSQLEITYEYAPFGGELGQTLVGARSELSLTQNIFLGSSILYNFAAKPTNLPTPQSAPSSIKVMEFDALIKDVRILDFPLKMNFGAEYAQSRKNPNVFGRAIVESMEGIKQEDSVSLNKDFWLPAANVSGGKSDYSKQSLANEDIKVLEINPNADAETDDTQQVLVFNYDVDTFRDESSIAYNFSKVGLDFSKKLYLEGTIYGDNSNNQLLITLGGISEDADADNVLDREDLNNDYFINEGEDVGWKFDNLDGTITRIGDNNGRLDTEDFDGDGSLDADNGTGSIFGGAGNPLIDSDGSSHSGIDWPASASQSGWKTFQIPLNITNEIDWQSIKNLRLTVKYVSSGGVKKGTIKIANLSVVGNKFEEPVVVNGGTMDILAINNEDNPGYTSLLFNPDYLLLYQDTSENNREQALELRYTGFTAASSGSTRVVYTKAVDFTAHKKLNFFIWHDGNPKTVFLQFGSEGSYYNIDIDLSASTPPGWHRYGIKMDDINNDQTADLMRAEGYSNVALSLTGSPSLKNISQIKLGVKNTLQDGGGGVGLVRFNEIFLDDVEEKVGEAKRLQGDFEYPNWARFGGTYREIDRNFETITSNITNQDRKEESAYMNISRLSFMPVNLRASKSITITPSSIDTGDSALVSTLEEGNVKTYAGAADTAINIPKLPKIGVGYSFSDSDSKNLKRQDHSDSYSGNLDYTFGVKFPLINVLPNSLASNYSLSKTFIYYRDALGRSNPISISESGSAKASFQPVLIDSLGGAGFSFNPSYSISQARESQRFPDNPIPYKYDKSLSQKASASSRIKIFSWLEPNLDYSISVDENNDVVISTSQVSALGTKTINRNASGRADWTFIPNKLIGNLKATQSLSLSADYSISDGDSYEYVDRYLKVFSFDTKDLFIHKKKLFEYSASTSTLINERRLKSLIWRDTVNLSGKWKPMEWIPSPEFLKPITGAFTNLYYTNSEEHSETTGTTTDTLNKVWPKYNLSLNNTEKLIFSEKFLANSNINYNYAQKQTTVQRISRSENFTRDSNWGFKTFNFLDWYFTYNDSKSYDYDLQLEIRRSRSFNCGWSSQVGFNFGKWRFTPNHSSSISKGYDSLNKLTSDKTSITESLKIRGDLDLPKVIRFPFTGSAWVLANRMIIDTQLSYSASKSSLNVESNNTKMYNLSTTVDYEISKNLRLAFSLGGSRLVNLKKADESYYTVEGSTKLTIQF